MVKFLSPFFFLFLVRMQTALAAPQIEISFPETIWAHFPIEGTVMITHAKQELVDPASFSLEGKSLEVSFVKDVAFAASSETLLSVFIFELPAKEAGLYTLGPITARVGGEKISSPQKMFQVQQMGQPLEETKSSSSLILKLEAAVEGPKTLYLGEQTSFVYRIYYNHSIDLSQSSLPLIHPEHFQKVGDVQIKEEQEGELTKQTLTQRVEASEVGVFSFGPSFIKGFFYVMQNGSKLYDKKESTAKAAVIQVEVKPFAQKGAPASFTGALGEIQIAASLISDKKITVGDLIELKLEIKGVSNLEELTLPKLSCSPGFNGFFAFDKAPPLAENKENSKFFVLKLRALTPLLEEILPIEVSSFNPKTGKFVTAKTKPIALSITPSAFSPLQSPFPLLPKEVFEKEKKKEWPLATLPPLNIPSK